MGHREVLPANIDHALPKGAVIDDMRTVTVTEAGLCVLVSLRIVLNWSQPHALQSILEHHGAQQSDRTDRLDANKHERLRYPAPERSCDMRSSVEPTTYFPDPAFIDYKCRPNL